MGSRRAFTLVELLIALALVGILAGVGTPYVLVNLPTYRVNAAVRQVVADLRLARTRAVEEGRDVFVRFYPAESRYVLHLDSDGNGSFDPALDEPWKTVALGELYAGIAFARYAGGISPSGGALPADGVSFAGDLAAFHPRGTARAGSVYLRPARDEGVRRDRERAVTVVLSTGRVRTYRWTGAGASGWE
jgi:type IV fimbrial biogenesis protein FimT